MVSLVACCVVGIFTLRFVVMYEQFGPPEKWLADGDGDYGQLKSKNGETNAGNTNLSVSMPREVLSVYFQLQKVPLLSYSEISVVGDFTPK